jgi:hypothetical protein
MEIQFQSTPEGRFARTVGLAEMGQHELMLVMGPAVGDEAAARVLNYIGDYIIASAQHIAPGETMRYGWSTLRFIHLPGTQDLAIEELANPFTAASESFVPGATKAITILAEQDATVYRNGIPKPAHHPHRSELAVVCRHVTPAAPPKVMVFDRLTSQRMDDSGWFIGCGDPNHNHNDLGELARIHLIYIAELDPKIVFYLALPAETRVVFDRGKALVFAPGQEEGRLDPGAVYVP